MVSSAMSISKSKDKGNSYHLFNQSFNNPYLVAHPCPNFHLPSMQQMYAGYIWSDTRTKVCGCAALHKKEQHADLHTLQTTGKTLFTMFNLQRHPLDQA